MKRSILVLEDDESIASLLRAALELEGYAVSVAGNGADGLELLDTKAPTLVVLDLGLPIIDGWGFARAMRRRGADVPIIIVSASRDAAAVAEEIGASRCIPKPFVVEDLLAAVRQLLRS